MLARSPSRLVGCALLAAALCANAAPAAQSAASAAASNAPAASSAISASSVALSSASAARGPPSVSSVEPASSTVAPASEDPNGLLWHENSNIHPEAIRGSLGADVIGPQNVPIDLENADLLAPPSTDSGTVGNAKWPMSLSHNRLQTGGWARQQNMAVMPLATDMAGVNMRLEAGAIRELHWHKTAEWSYILKGQVVITVVTQDDTNYIATLNPGDVWYFPPGVPHSIQATSTLSEGSEFLLVFDSGAFSEDDTFLLTDWLAHVPKEVLAKNFQTDIKAFSRIPGKELYIFPATPPSPNSVAPKAPKGTASQAFSFEFSKVNFTDLPGGKVRIIDSRTFPISTTIAAAEVMVEPGAIRELHWHPKEDEWSFFLEGTGRATIFAGSSNARTFDFQPGDVGYVPASFGHFVENTGNTTLRFLEIFKSDRFEDISLQQWLALVPPELVKAHLDLDDDTIANLNPTKGEVVAPTPA